MTQASSRYGKVLRQISKETERSGNVATKYAPRMERVSSGTTEAKIALSRAYARESGPA